jgi:hypothetical protein
MVICAGRILLKFNLTLTLSPLLLQVHLYGDLILVSHHVYGRFVIAINAEVLISLNISISQLKIDIKTNSYLCNRCSYILRESCHYY